MTSTMTPKKKRKYFGTDGIRAQANTYPMTASMAMRVAQATALYFRETQTAHRPKVVIGKDTRLSGYMIENAMTAGFVSMGMDVVMVGPMPTPAIAMLVRSLRADLGVMISASHNPYQDNGIKLFAADGFKLSDDVELAIEALIDQPDAEREEQLASSGSIGRAMRVDEESGRYIEHVKRSFPRDLSLHGLKIVVDCAHGAAYKAAPKILWELGADVIPLGVNPNGTNINDGVGATATQAMQDAVVAHGADIGLALDGDADRLIVADEKGNRLDGDQIIAAVATDWHQTGKLLGDGIAMNAMSNLGLHDYLSGLGLRLHRTGIGDRYVMAEMRAQKLNLGGEQSGHFVMLDTGTTGDGLVAGLQVLAALKRQNVPASTLLNVFTPWPQVQRNLKLVHGNPLESSLVQQRLAQIEQDIEGQGRILVRKSGTQPLIRILAEAKDNAQAQEIADQIETLLTKEMTAKAA